MTAMERRACAWLVGALLCGCADVATPSGVSASVPAALLGTTLPGGTPLEVELDEPTGADVPAGPVAVSGRIDLGIGPVPKDTAVVYVIDLSGSTQDPAGACGGNFNGDQFTSSILDCELASIAALDELAASQGNVAEVGLVVFGESAAIADLDAADDLQPRRAPGGEDLDTVLRSVRIGEVRSYTKRVVGRVTNYAAAVNAAAQALDGVTATRRLVVFLSDGFASGGGDLQPVLDGLSPDIRFFTFAISEKARCVPPPELVDAQGTLQQIAEATGGTCTNVTDPSQLPQVLPDVLGSQLTGVELRVNDASVPGALTLSTALPLEGPGSLTFTGSVDLAPGDHDVCVRAVGRDAGGEGVVERCVSVRVVGDNAPPTLTCVDRVVPAGADCRADASIVQSLSDPDGDPTTCAATPAGPYVLGVTAVALTCSDDEGAAASCAASVTVVDQEPPVVSAPFVGATLWPANHKYKDVRLAECVTAVSDACGGSIDPDATGQIVRITSDESEKVEGSGDSCVDAVIAGPSTARLRAERTGGGDGRIYTIVFTVADTAGNAREASCRVQVWHDQGGGSFATDSGCRYCVGSGCGACPGPVPGCK